MSSLCFICLVIAIIYGLAIKNNSRKLFSLSLRLLQKYRNPNEGGLFETLLVSWYARFIIRIVLKIKTLKNLKNELGWKGFMKWSLITFRDQLYQLCGGRIYNAVERKGNRYSLTYKYGSNSYKICWKGKRGPQKITQITNEINEDVTQIVKAFMGPSENFHGLHLTPHDLGFESLTFYDMYGGSKTFNSTSVLLLQTL